MDKELVRVDRKKVIEILKKHFTSRKKLSYDINEEDNKVQCFYRGPKGNKCAIGLFIPDGRYYKGLEGETTFRFFEKDPDPLEEALVGKNKRLYYYDKNFLLECQRIHDAWAEGEKIIDYEEFKERLEWLLT